MYQDQEEAQQSRGQHNNTSGHSNLQFLWTKPPDRNGSRAQLAEA
jgi:hypothetical protein